MTDDEFQLQFFNLDQDRVSFQSHIQIVSDRMASYHLKISRYTLCLTKQEVHL